MTGMEPRFRTPLLVAGVFFCVAFAYLTITVAVRSGFSALSLVSFLIIAMIATG